MSYQWVQALALRYQRATADRDHADPALLEHLHEVTLASAVLDKLQMITAHPAHRVHIVVLGPTQSGKSTLVNVLLDERVANVSPLAGFTVHSQGYGRVIDQSDATLVQSMMEPLTRTAAAELDGTRLDSYVLETVTSGPKSLVGNAIVWDTPDFDSISADSYSLAVLKSAAIADVAVLMVSKDKYGDKRVWDMLALLHGTGKPLLVCINKVANADRAVIEHAFNTRYLEYLKQSPPPLILLPFIRDKQEHNTLPLDDKSRQLLRGALLTLYKRIDSQATQRYFSEFVGRHQAQWVQPLLDQLDARDQWHGLVLSVINEADEYYEQNYLNNPDRYNTFNRALAELLILLEIPGVAAKLVQARKVITWPARRLLGAGRQALSSARQTNTDAQGDIMDQEAQVLERMLDHVLLALQRQLLEAPITPWWQELDRQLRKAMPAIRQHYLEAGKQARQSFNVEIEKAAELLYKQLETQPVLLNSLRAARVTTDAAAIALAVKSGGLAPTDLVLAPAMLSVTTLLTENALGRYLDTIKRDLKRRQRLHIKEQVLELVLLTRLMQCSDDLNSPEFIATNLEPELNDYLQSVRKG